MVLDDESNQIGEEFNINEIEFNLVNNIVSKPEELSEPSRRNIRFLRQVRCSRMCNQFFLGFIPRKTATFEKISLTLISQTGCNLNIDGAYNREEIFEH